MPLTPALPCTEVTAEVTSSVLLIDMIFMPSCVKAQLGDSIVFLDYEPVVHTVTADPSQPETFDSGPLSEYVSYTHVFDVAGTYDLECTLHPGTTARVFIAP